LNYAGFPKVHVKYLGMQTALLNVNEVANVQFRSWSLNSWNFPDTIICHVCDTNSNLWSCLDSFSNSCMSQWHLLSGTYRIRVYILTLLHIKDQAEL
jgi:hypothetical protein